MNCHDMRLELRWLIFYMLEALAIFIDYCHIRNPPFFTGSGLDQPGYVPPRIIRRPAAIQLRRVKVWQYINT